VEDVTAAAEGGTSAARAYRHICVLANTAGAPKDTSRAIARLFSTQVRPYPFSVRVSTAASSRSASIAIVDGRPFGVRLEEADVRTTGRGTYGVRGIELREESRPATACVAAPGSKVSALFERHKPSGRRRRAL
jgi:hypothetical protein